MTVIARRFAARSALVALLVAGGLFASGCGIPTAKTAVSIPAKTVPDDLLSPVAPTTTPTTRPGGYVQVPVYFTKTGIYVTPVARYVPPPKSLTSVVGVLLQGPTPTEQHNTAIGTALDEPGVKLLSSPQKERNMITLNFNGAFGLLSGSQEALGVAQVVFTVAQNEPDPSAVGVLFEITTLPTDVPLVTDELVGGPVHMAQYSTLLAPTAATTTTTAP